MKATNYGDGSQTKQGNFDGKRNINEQRETSQSKSGATERQDPSYQR